MDVYRSKKVLLDGLRPARLYVQNGKIMRVLDGYDLPENTDGERDKKDNLGQLIHEAIMVLFQETKRCLWTLTLATLS